MTTDLLWCDADKNRPMAEKIANAILYYEEKYEQPVRVVRVSVKDQQDLGEASFLSSIDLQSVIVVWSGRVLKHHMAVSPDTLA